MDGISTVIKMVKLLSIVLLFVSLLSFSSESRSILPSILDSSNFKLNLQITARRCSYSVAIKTSCSSPSYTRDKVSLDFGDAYGNEVYASRLDDPSGRIFERCSTDTFEITGPCTNDICYLYLLRVGSDGWKPENVKIYGANRRVLTYTYNTFLPNGVWFGFNHCKGGSTSMVM